MAILELSPIPFITKPYEVKHLVPNRQKENGSAEPRQTEAEVPNSQAVLTKMHFDAISAASEHFDFMSHGSRHKVSTLRKDAAVERPPKPSAGDIWLEVTVNTYSGNLPARMYEPTPFDIANSRVAIKRAKQGRNGVITETLYTIGSNSEQYEAFLRNGVDKTIPQTGDRFVPAVRKADALIRHHIADLRRRQSVKPL